MWTRDGEGGGDACSSDGKRRRSSKDEVKVCMLAYVADGCNISVHVPSYSILRTALV